MKRRIFDSPFGASKVRYFLLAMLLAVSLMTTYSMLAFGEGEEDASLVSGELSGLEGGSEGANESEGASGSEVEGEDELVPEQSLSGLEDSEKSATYDVQPTTKEEVQSIIDEYSAAYSEAMESGDILAALAVPKPHWKYEVTAELMPSGYECQLVNWDEDFGADYYTFFPLPVTLSSTWDGTRATSITSGSGTAGDPYQIWSAQELAFVAQQVNLANATYANAHYILMDDLDLAGLAWTRIGSCTSGLESLGSQAPFRGTFDGNGKTISRLYINTTTAVQGLFGGVWNATIKNLTVEGSVRGGQHTGLLVGASNANLTLENCVARGTVIGTGGPTGGLIGFIATGSEGTGSNVASGRIITVKDCYANVDVTSSSYYSGGLVGYVLKNDYSTNSQILISNCHAVGNVSASYWYNGGLAGFVEIYASPRAAGCSIVFDGCSASGNVTANGHYNGGLLGHIHNGVVVKNSWATGDVYGVSNDAGGLIGYAYGWGDGVATTVALHDPRITVENCYATGNSRGAGVNNNVGGLIGRADNTNIFNSYATGNVRGPATNSIYIGGLVGELYSSPLAGAAPAEIKNCYATGTVMSTSAGSGGLVGGAYNSAVRTNLIFSNCFYDGTTTKKTNAMGTPAGNIPASAASIVQFTTEEMIDVSSWGFDTPVRDNINGASAGSGTNAAPWYIDDDITYPYLYYQYDGHTKDEVNYFLGAVYYTTDNGATYKGLAQDRADFVMGTSTVSAYFRVSSQGAAQAYFPYVVAHYPFGAYGTMAKGITINAPTSNFSFTANAPYSLGSVSQSNIVAFTNVPYAEKGSDRKVWVDGSPSTYTKRGDIINYWIETINPSTDYEWRGVEITDELAEGLTLVSDSVKITEQLTDSSGNVASSTTTALTTTPNVDGLYYTCTYVSSTNRFSLTVHLPDHPAIDETTNLVYSVLTEYQVLVGKDAVSLFPLSNWTAENGDNIRNSGSATGILHLVHDPSEFFPHETEFDDENTDPVYDTYKVTYHGNGGTFSDTVTNTYEEYYLLDASYTILSNLFDTNGDGTKDEGFAYSGHEWQNWYDTATPSSTDTPLKAGDTHSITYTLDSTGKYTFSDVDIYADWLPLFGSIKIVKFENDGTTPLPGAVFKLEKLDDQGDVDTSFTAIYETTGSDGILMFTNVFAGTYQVTETKAPAGFIQLTQPFEVVIPYTITLPSSSTPEPDYLYTTTDSGSGDITYYYFNVTYQVSDQAALVMPIAGVEDAPYYLYLGVLLLAAALLCGAIYRYKRLKIPKSSN